MSKLYEDILHLIFKELDKDKFLYPLLLVNRTWCEIAMPILWRNPWRIHKNFRQERALLVVIVSFLTDEARDNMLSQGLNLLIKPDKQPLFNYISFCRRLDLCGLEQVIYTVMLGDQSKRPIIVTAILKLFINENMKYEYLCIPMEFNYQIHLFPGFENCFSKLESIRCDFEINRNILNGLTDVCKSIKKLEINAIINSSEGVIELMKSQIRLEKVCFQLFESVDVIELQRELIKHSNTIQHLTISDRLVPILPSFTDLQSLKIINVNEQFMQNLNISHLTSLQRLETCRIPFNILISSIENIKGNLLKIKISCAQYEEYNGISNKILIRAIYQHCPKLQCIKLSVSNDEILEFENLLINCKYLDELTVKMEQPVDWVNFINILIRSAPNNLFKFKFIHDNIISLEALELFLNNWKGRHPMHLRFTIMSVNLVRKHFNLIDDYVMEGVVKKFRYQEGYEDYDYNW